MLLWPDPRPTIPDLLVGANLDERSTPAQAQAFVFSGLDGNLIHTLRNPTAQAVSNFGAAVAGAGDLNGDMIPDLIVVADLQDVTPSADQGQVFDFNGADGGLLTTLDNPACPSQEFGSARNHWQKGSDHIFPTNYVARYL